MCVDLFSHVFKYSVYKYAISLPVSETTETTASELLFYQLIVFSFSFVQYYFTKTKNKNNYHCVDISGFWIIDQTLTRLWQTFNVA